MSGEVPRVSEVRLERRSVPDQLHYLAAELRKGEQPPGLVALALDVLADEVERSAATPRGS